MVIPIHQLPGVSPLVHDYFYEYDKVREFFSGNFRDPTAFSYQAGRVRSRDLPRERLAAVLKEMNQGYGCGEATVANINALIQDTTCAVVTGQQVGLFSGPLYTIYKAITAIKLAESLGQNSPGGFVPVFWLASDDHDFAEINHITLLDKENRLKDIQYQEPSLSQKTPVSRIILTTEISNCFQQLRDSTHDSEFRPDILSQLGTAYQPGRSFVEAFARWMTRLFKSYGLIFVDAGHPGLKDLGKEVFFTEVAQKSPSTRCVLETSRKLAQKNYSVQVRLHEGILNVFLVEKERRAILFGDTDYSIKGTSERLAGDELLERLEAKPHLFSPNVLLRPLYQDKLLPTVAYVAGPAEISYFAQMKDVYQTFKIPMPIIYPRKGLTLVDKKVDRTLNIYGLEFEDLWRNTDAKIKEVAEEKIPRSLEKAIHSAAAHLDRDMNDVRREIRAFEPTLEKTIDLTVRKTRYFMNQLEEKILKASKKRNAVVIQRIRLAKNSLYPKSQLQERVFNITPFLIKYGFAFMDRLYKAVDIDHHEHHILKL